MSCLLADPSAVLVVGGADDDVDRIDSAVTAGTATHVVTVASVDDACEAIETRDDVGCVLVLDQGEVSLAAVCGAIRGVSESLPVVVHVEDASYDVGDLARWSDCRYFPRSATGLCDVVDDALETFDRRRRQAAESSLFDTLLDGARDPIFVKDRQGRHLYLSDYPDGPGQDSALGKTDPELAINAFRDTAERTLEDDLAVVESGEPLYENPEHYDGEDFDVWLETTKLPWRDDQGDVRGLVGYAHGVTEKKELERQLRMEEQRFDQFASYVSHDLRTPLQIIYGAVELARKGNEDALDRIETSVERIEGIVEDLNELSVSQRLSGPTDVPTDPAEADLPSADLVRLVENVWSVVGVDEATLDSQLPTDAVVGVDEALLRPLVENLLKNTIDHAGPDVTVTVGTIDGEGFFVEDDGPGIDEEEQDKVLREGYTTAADGFGTGLQIVSEVVDKYDWGLTITDGTDDGARFEVTDCPVAAGWDVDVTPGRPIPLSESVDVGPVEQPGTAEYDEETDSWTVVAGGLDLWGDINEFHFVHDVAEAPFRIQGHVEGLDAAHAFSKAGFMIRGSDAEHAPYGFVGRTGSAGSELLWREAAGEDGTSAQLGDPVDAFPWYRIETRDGTITCYLSRDGAKWHPVDQRSIAASGDLAVGLAVCSHDPAATCEATFTDVRAFEFTVD